MPLIALRAGEEGKVCRVTGKDEKKKFLESLGFVSGTTVKVISQTSGGMILGIKGGRVALDKSMARRILV